MHIRRLLLALVLGAAALPVFANVQPRRMPRPRPQPTQAQQPNDEESLNELVREWADAVVHGDFRKLDRIHDNAFKGSSEGKNFDKQTLRQALASGVMKVAGWTIEDVKVKLTGNTAVVTGKSTLTNAVFMGDDFSGEYEWSNRFVKQRDGSWRAVSSQSKRVKK